MFIGALCVKYLDNFQCALFGLCIIWLCGFFGCVNYLVCVLFGVCELIGMCIIWNSIIIVKIMINFVSFLGCIRILKSI